VDTTELFNRLFRNSVGALELYTVYVGERLGLYRALADIGPATSAQLAAQTGTSERYIREWLEHHATAGLVEVDDATADPLERRYFRRRTTSQSLPTPTTRSIRATKVSKLCALLAPCRTW